MKNRPVILVDLDNVVYDWCYSMAEYLFINGAVNATPEVMMKKYKTWEVWDDWGIPKGEFLRWWRLGIEEGRIYGMGPEIEGARDALWRLSDAEWHIHIATSRLTKFGLHDKIVENTAQWLRDHNIPYRDLSFTSNKKAIRADAIVDDRVDNMSKHMHAYRFTFAAPHNNSTTTWDHVLYELLEKNHYDG